MTLKTLRRAIPRPCPWCEEKAPCCYVRPDGSYLSLCCCKSGRNYRRDLRSSRA